MTDFAGFFFIFDVFLIDEECYKTYWAIFSIPMQKQHYNDPIR